MESGKNFLEALVSERSLVLIVLLGGLLITGTASAEDVDYTSFGLDELMEMDVVYGASRYEQKTSEAPSSVTVITADDIRTLGYRTLSDVLNSVAGFYTTDDRNYSYAGVRGFLRPGDYNTRLLVLVDGNRINDNVYDAAGVGRDFPIDLDMVERIEIVRGAGSSVYGTSAFFGVINVTTKDPKDVEGFQVWGEGASYGTLASTVTYGATLESGLGFLVSGTALNAEGQDLYFPEFDDPSTNSGVFRDGDFEAEQKLFAQASFGRVTLRGVYSNRDKGIPTASYVSLFNDNRAQTTDRTSYLDLSYEPTLGNDRYLLTRISLNSYDYNGLYPYDGADEGDPPLPIVFEEFGKGEWVNGEVRFSGSLGSRNRFVTGAEFRSTLKAQQTSWDQDPFYPYLNEGRHADSWGMYVQDEVRIGSRLALHLGIRHDQYESFGGSTNPQGAVLVHPRDGTTLKFLMGRAFRAPNAYELYYDDGGISQKANPNLLPEEMSHTELILEQALGSRVKGSVAAYELEIDGLIDITADPADDLLVYQNVRAVHGHGVEIGLDTRMLRRLHGRASYTWQESTDKANDQILTNSPRHMFKASAFTSLGSPSTTLGLDLQYMSERKTLGGDVAASHFLTSMSLVQRFDVGFELRAGVSNLFDVVYGDPGGEEHEQDILQRDGRTFRLRLSYTR